MDTPQATIHKNRCLYCGNNPTNHTMSLLFQSLSSLGTPLEFLARFCMRGSVVTFLHNTFVRAWIGTLETVRMVRFQSDSSKACSDRSLVIWKEAERRGILMQQMVIANKPVEQYRLQHKGQWYYFSSIPIPLEADRQSYIWMDSKIRLKEFFMKHKVAVPQGGRARSKKKALEIFHAIQKPVIVKPENGSRGRHSLTNLSTEAQFLHAFKIARQLSYSVVVEEHLVGSVYRATYVGGVVAGILRGDPPRITGDGVATIEALITRKNITKPDKVKDVVVTPVILEFLEKQGYTLSSVLENGKTIDVIEKIGLSYGGNSSEDTPLAHPKLLLQLQHAGDLLNTPLVGFDFISEDISKDPDTVRWGIIEANSMPFIDLHHFPREGTPVNVAAKVWDMWKL
jgi:cyanophycin synthetase